MPLTTFWANPWVTDITTGLIVALVLGVPALAWRWMRRELKALMTEVRPNGGDTLSAGDTLKRVENKVDALIVTVAEQKGHTDAVEREVYKRIGKLETREQVEVRLAHSAE